MNNIKVSICCVTYNQEKYIREALDSFLSQKVNFKYEIIVHDDASTDNTRKILEEYEKKYPGIVFPIYEEKNVYSVNPNAIVTKTFERARGEFIALCDGDDFWSDNNKLQMQVDCMNKNKNMKLCFHKTLVIDSNNKKVDQISSKKYGLITIDDFLSGDVYMHTSSMFFRKCDIEELPNYFYDATVADLPLKLYLLSLGYGYNIDKTMSFYRVNSKGSWTENQKNDINKLKSNHDMEINLYNSFNSETKYKHDSFIKKRINEKNFNYYMSINEINELKKTEYKSLYKKLSLKQKLKIKLKSFKYLYKLYLKMKYRSR